MFVRIFSVIGLILVMSVVQIIIQIAFLVKIGKMTEGELRMLNGAPVRIANPNNMMPPGDTSMDMPNLNPPRPPPSEVFSERDASVSW